MKKLFASILCLGMIFGATGCTSGGVAEINKVKPIKSK